MQFESIAGFGAIIDRLGEFAEVLEPYSRSRSEHAHISASEPSKSSEAVGTIRVEDVTPSPSAPLLKIQDLTLRSPDGFVTLVENMSAEVSHLSSLNCI